MTIEIGEEDQANQQAGPADLEQLAQPAAGLHGALAEIVAHRVVQHL